MTDVRGAMHRPSAAALRRTASPAELLWRLQRYGIRGCLRRLLYRASLERAGMYSRWVRKYDQPSQSDLGSMRAAALSLSTPPAPTFSVIMPVYNTRASLLAEAVESIRRQVYPHWELCIADDASDRVETIAQLAGLVGQESVRVVRRSSRGGISACSNDAIASATGDFLVFLDHDDRLAPHALYAVAAAISGDPTLDIVYSDEDKLDRRGRRYGPYFKPEPELDLLLGQNYWSHLTVIRTSLVRLAGGLREDLDGSQDWDLALRALSLTDLGCVHHIPHVLYSWRQYRGSGSFADRRASVAVDAGRHAVADYLTNVHPQSTVEAHPVLSTCNRVRWPLPNPIPEVSLILGSLPFEEPAGDLPAWVRSSMAQYPGRCEAVVIRHTHSTVRATGARPREDGIREVVVSTGSSPSEMYNAAVEQADGSIVCFLDPTLISGSPGWLEEMCRIASRSVIGPVGAKLLYQGDAVAHAGYVLGMRGVVGRPYDRHPSFASGYHGRLQLTREVSAVSRACLVLQRSVFLEVGGFDSDRLSDAHNDVDLCLRLRERGYRTLWTPHAVLSYPRSRRRRVPGELRPTAPADEHMLKRWSQAVACDPKFNPNLSLERVDYRLAFPPRGGSPWS